MDNGDAGVQHERRQDEQGYGGGGRPEGLRGGGGEGASPRRGIYVLKEGGPVFFLFSRISVCVTNIYARFFTVFVLL